MVGHQALQGWALFAAGLRCVFLKARLLRPQHMPQHFSKNSSLGMVCLNLT